jgi:hypothetical protein
VGPSVEEKRCRVVEEQTHEHPSGLGDELVHVGKERRERVRRKIMPVVVGSRLSPGQVGKGVRGEHLEPRNSRAKPDLLESLSDAVACPVCA